MNPDLPEKLKYVAISQIVSGVLNFFFMAGFAYVMVNVFGITCFTLGAIVCSPIGCLGALVPLVGALVLLLIPFGIAEIVIGGLTLTQPETVAHLQKPFSMVQMGMIFFGGLTSLVSGGLGFMYLSDPEVMAFLESPTSSFGGAPSKPPVITATSTEEPGGPPAPPSDDHGAPPPPPVMEEEEAPEAPAPPELPNSEAPEAAAPEAPAPTEAEASAPEAPAAPEPPGPPPMPPMPQMPGDESLADAPPIPSRGSAPSAAPPPPPVGGPPPLPDNDDDTTS